MSFARTRDAGKHEVDVKRIVSTLPSATEIVCLLGLEEELVGVTHECDYPPAVKKKPVVIRSVFDTQKMENKEIDLSVLAQVTQGGSLYNINQELLKSLKPDLIITQELCNVCATPLGDISKAIDNLEPRPNVLSLTPHDLENVLEDVMRVGKAAGKDERARKVVTDLQRRIDVVTRKCGAAKEKPSVFCLEWMDPIYCSGHWMPELVRYAGGKELIGKVREPSTVVSWDKVVEADPEVIFVMVCGYDVKRTLGEINALTDREGWDNIRAVRNGMTYITDGSSYYSRSGPRLVEGLEIMAYVLHRDLFSNYTTPKHSVYSLTERKFI